MIQIVIQSLFFAKSYDFWRLEEPVELFEKGLLVDLSCDLFPEVDIVRTRLNLDRLEQGVDVLGHAARSRSARWWCWVTIKL